MKTLKIHEFFSYNFHPIKSVKVAFFTVEQAKRRLKRVGKILTRLQASRKLGKESEKLEISLSWIAVILSHHRISIEKNARNEAFFAHFAHVFLSSFYFFIGKPVYHITVGFVLRDETTML